VSLADHSVTASIEKRLKTASREINQLAPLLGQAKQVLSFESDRRKNLLAKYAAKHLADESAAAAEQLARADPAYLSDLEVLAGEVQTAYGVIAKNDALHCTWESARSLLALVREQIRTMPEN